MPVWSAVCECFVAPWWSAYTCSLKPNDPTLKPSLVEDTHVQTIFFSWEPILRGPGVDQKLASLELNTIVYFSENGRDFLILLHTLDRSCYSNVRAEMHPGETSSVVPYYY